MAGKSGISGATRVCFIVGAPVTQVKTPSVFNAWAQKNGVDAVMLALDLAESGLAPFMQAMRHWSNCVGCVVTYPHKQAACRELDESTPEASFVGAANVVRRTADGRLVGGMTDGLGQFEALKARIAGISGADMLLIGAGGAGSAIAFEAARRGVGRLAIVEPDEGRRRALTERLEARFPSLACLDHVPADFRFDIACNASPVGMNGDPGLPFPVERFHAATIVSDAVPAPAITPWLELARRRGLRIQTGPEMVYGQFPHVIAHLFPGEAVPLPDG